MAAEDKSSAAIARQLEVFEEHGHFYTKQDALYFRERDGDMKIFPK